MAAPSDMLFSIIVPVYNRPDEVAELVRSLQQQTDKNFELVIVEDGSTVPCLDANALPEGLSVQYFTKPNEGRSIARNYGLEHTKGDYFIFVDSDCILPEDYIATLRRDLTEHYYDCYGGPDTAHESFSDTQKAINYSMTAFLTTGGIRGGKVSMEKFTPRTFNMGFSREVYDKVGGFREMFSEDIDMSTRIRQAGFTITLFPDVKVFHKRRVDFRKFWRQVHVFGMSRITLKLLYPDSLKAVHLLPAVFTVGCLALAIGGIWWHWLWIPLVVHILLLLGGALLSTGSFKIACLAVVAAFVQLFGYGTGFLKAWFLKIVLGKGRDINKEVEIRKGANEKL